MGIDHLLKLVSLLYEGFYPSRQPDRVIPVEVPTDIMPGFGYLATIDAVPRFRCEKPKAYRRDHLETDSVVVLTRKSGAGLPSWLAYPASRQPHPRATGWGLKPISLVSDGHYCSSAV